MKKEILTALSSLIAFFTGCNSDKQPNFQDVLDIVNHAKNGIIVERQIPNSIFHGDRNTAKVEKLYKIQMKKGELTYTITYSDTSPGENKDNPDQLGGANGKLDTTDYLDILIEREDEAYTQIRDSGVDCLADAVYSRNTRTAVAPYYDKDFPSEYTETGLGLSMIPRTQWTEAQRKAADRQYSKAVRDILKQIQAKCSK